MGKAAFWLLVGGVFLLALYGVKDILTPFLVGMAVAYLLDPLADMWEHLGVSRGWAAILALAPFFLIAGVILILLVPLLKAQIGQFLIAFPGYMARAVHLLTDVFDQLPALTDQMGRDGGRMSVADIGGYTGDILSWLAGALGGLWSGGLALFNTLSLLVVMPVVAFYLLRDWDVLVGYIDDLLPRAHADTIRCQLRLIDQSLSGFLRGAGLVCLCLSVFYSLALSLIGLQFGLLIGLIAGLMSFVPYVGALAGLLTGLAVAAVQFQELTPVLLVASVFIAGQMGEGYFLTPRLVGDRVGLHPLWLLFALMAGGALMGFVGLLLAVPVAAVCGVLCRFMIDSYRGSAYYAPTPSSVRRRTKKQVR